MLPLLYEAPQGVRQFGNGPFFRSGIRENGKYHSGIWENGKYRSGIRENDFVRDSEKDEKDEISFGNSGKSKYLFREFVKTISFGFFGSGIRENENYRSGIR